MSVLRPEEEWARRIIEASVGAPVAQHDDGSMESMYDLRISYPDERVGAVEVTAAADGESIALWRLMNEHEQRWQVSDIVGGWLVTLRPDSRAKRVRRGLPRLLALLEASGVTEFDPDYSQGGTLRSAVIELGILHALQSGTSHPGSIYITIERSDGFTGVLVDSAHQSIGPWVGNFLADTARVDVLSKLARSGADKRHAFVVVPAFATAPAEVVQALITEQPPLPDLSPALPSEVTDVWLVGTWSTPWGLWWSAESGWIRVNKLLGAPPPA